MADSIRLVPKSTGYREVESHIEGLNTVYINETLDITGTMLMSLMELDNGFQVTVNQQVESIEPDSWEQSGYNDAVVTAWSSIDRGYRDFNVRIPVYEPYVTSCEIESYVPSYSRGSEFHKSDIVLKGVKYPTGEVVDVGVGDVYYLNAMGWYQYIYDGFEFTEDHYTLFVDTEPLYRRNNSMEWISYTLEVGTVEIDITAPLPSGIEVIIPSIYTMSDKRVDWSAFTYRNLYSDGTSEEVPFGTWDSYEPIGAPVDYILDEDRVKVSLHCEYGSATWDGEVYAPCNSYLLATEERVYDAEPSLVYRQYAYTIYGEWADTCNADYSNDRFISRIVAPNATSFGGDFSGSNLYYLSIPNCTSLTADLTNLSNFTFLYLNKARCQIDLDKLKWNDQPYPPTLWIYVSHNDIEWYRSTYPVLSSRFREG